MSEPDYSTISPGVRELVRRLRAAGFDTCDSGDGSNHAAGMECARPEPHVTIRVADPRHLAAEGHRLRDIVVSWGVAVRAMAVDPTPCIQATFDPANGFAFLDLMHVTDVMLGPSRWCSARLGDSELVVGVYRTPRGGAFLQFGQIDADGSPVELVADGSVAELVGTLERCVLWLQLEGASAEQQPLGPDDAAKAAKQ